MKYLSLYTQFNRLNEEKDAIPWDILKNLNIPGVPKEFDPDDEEKIKSVVCFILDKLKIKYNVMYHHDITCYKFLISHSMGDLELSIIDYELIISDDPYGIYDFDEIDTPIDLINYLFELDLINNDRIFKKINENIFDSIKVKVQEDINIEIEIALRELKIPYEIKNTTLGHEYRFTYRELEYGVVSQPMSSLGYCNVLLLRGGYAMENISDVSKIKDLILTIVDTTPWFKQINESVNDNIELGHEYGIIPLDGLECSEYIRDILDRHRIRYEEYEAPEYNTVSFDLIDKKYKITGGHYVDEDDGEVGMVLFITKKGLNFKDTLNNGYCYKNDFLTALLSIYGVNMIKTIKKINGFG